MTPLQGDSAQDFLKTKQPASPIAYIIKQNSLICEKLDALIADLEQVKENLSIKWEK